MRDSQRLRYERVISSNFEILLILAACTSNRKHKRSCVACKFVNTETVETARRRLSELIYSRTRIVTTAVKDTRRIERIRRLGSKDVSKLHR